MSASSFRLQNVECPVGMNVLQHAKNTTEKRLDMTRGLPVTGILVQFSAGKFTEYSIFVGGAE